MRRSSDRRAGRPPSRGLTVIAWRAAAVAVLAACAPQPAPTPFERSLSPASAPAASVPASWPAASASVAPPQPAAPPPIAASDAATVEASVDGGLRPPADASAVGEVLALQARLSFVDTVVGTGREARDGDHVSVHCTGTLADGTTFESSRARKRPLQFVVGGDKVVLGLAEGVAGMRVGGRRTLTVPPSLGYGRRGSGTKVPPGATLVFDVELLSVK